MRIVLRVIAWVMWVAGMLIVAAVYGAVALAMYLFGSAICGYLASREE